MESFKKVISLNQAAKISGYTQDYLGYLVRNGEIRGVKNGRVWFTTEEDVKNYIFKKKVRSEKLAIREFFSPSRTKNIIIATVITAVALFFVWTTFINNKNSKEVEVRSTLSPEQEGSDIWNKN